MTTKYMQSAYNPFNSQAKMLKHWSNLDMYVRHGDTMPIMIEVNLSSNCLLNCAWCISGNTHKKEYIDTPKLMKFLKEFKFVGGKAVNWSGGGEPTTHPDFERIVLGTKDIGLDQGLMTAGTFPTTLVNAVNLCDWVRFSVDYSDKELYKKNKGADMLDVVKRNIELVTVKKGLNVNLYARPKFLKQVNGVWDLAQRTGCDYIQVRPILPRNYMSEKLTEDHRKHILAQIKFFKTIDGKVQGKTKITFSWDKYYDLVKKDYGRTYTKCKGHMFEPVIDSNGDLCVCMYFLRNKDFIMGNIYEQSFSRIWNSQRRKEVKKMCNNLDFCKCQVCCKCHEINKLLDFIDNAKLEDVNFI